MAMATITTRTKTDGTLSYRAMIRIKKKGKIVLQESKTFSKEAAAKRWAKKREVELEDSENLAKAIHSKNGGFTVGDLIDEYIKKAGAIHGWSRSKGYTLEALKKFDIAEKDALSITAKDIVDHCTLRAEKHGVKPATINQDYIYLKGIYGVAEHLLGCPVSVEPFLKAKPVLDKYGLIGKSKKRIRRPSIQEMTDVVSLAYRRRHGSYHATHDFAPMDKIIVFAMFSSRRVSEICRLLWEDFNKESRTIVVRKPKGPDKNKRNNVEGDLVCHLPKEALAVIESIPREDNEPRIFPYNSRSVGSNYARLRADAGWAEPDESLENNLRFHDLRHEAISWLFEKNGYKGEAWDIPRVAKVSGHKSWSSLQVYEDIISPDPRDRWEDWEWKTKVLD